VRQTDQTRALAAAVLAARAAGKLMRANLRARKTISSSTQYDIKLELDVRCQKLIERSLRARFPQIALLGEEGASGDSHAAQRWVVDPIDGTVNFSYSVPHACVSIALQERTGPAAGYADGYETLVGVVYDPFCDELWTATKGRPPRLNGIPIRVSRRRKLKESLVAIGFAKSPEDLQATLPAFLQVVPRVRKIRIMGAAALSLAYVATGRFDAYIERGISLWDIAAGGFLVECAGGDFWREPRTDHRYRMVASNGLLARQLPRPG